MKTMLFSLMIFMVVFGCNQNNESVPVPDIILGESGAIAQTTTANGFTLFDVDNQTQSWEASIFGIDAEGDTIAAMIYDCSATETADEKYTVKQLHDITTYTSLVEYQFAISIFKKVDHHFFVRSPEVSKAILIIKAK